MKMIFENIQKMLTFSPFPTMCIRKPYFVKNVTVEKRQNQCGYLNSYKLKSQL